MSEDSKHKPQDMTPVHSSWGSIPADNFGYADDEERRRCRGLEDWELVEKIPESQRRVPPWFFAVVVAVLLVAIGLSFPFWGIRPGHERAWIDWGFGAAIVYLLVFGAFVYFMVNFYGSSHAGRLDSDPEHLPDEVLRKEQRQADKDTASS